MFIVQLALVHYFHVPPPIYLPSFSHFKEINRCKEQQYDWFILHLKIDKTAVIAYASSEIQFRLFSCILQKLNKLYKD